ncbi:MAG: outer membrane beta-barrel protein [Tannerella sp.]|jgi:outer membrane protein W|nr:outer membrane beta-barrel protein [Tannerella sp.]
MKKYLFVLVAVTMMLTAVKGQTGNGFKPEKGSFSLEVGFSSLDTDSASISIPKGQIRGVYMVSDNLAFRLGVGIDTDSKSDDNGQTEDEWIHSTKRSTKISFTPGIAYYLSGTERLAPYLGAELLISVDSKNSITEGRNFKQIIRNEGELFNTFGIGVFSGFNYYFAKHLYAGVEVGLGIKLKSLNNTVIETTQGGSTATVEPKDKVNKTAFGTEFNPAIRLGWVF